MKGNTNGEFSGFNAMQILPFLKELYDTDKKVERFPGLLENVFLKSCNSNAN
jgi:hypothetical protein